MLGQTSTQLYMKGQNPNSRHVVQVIQWQVRHTCLYYYYYE